MNNKELLIDFIEYAKSRHVMPILHSNIKPLVDDYLSSKNDGKPIVSGALPLKVCTGCGWRNDKPLRSKIALACCPDNHYVELDDYLKHSVYKRQ